MIFEVLKLGSFLQVRVHEFAGSPEKKEVFVVLLLPCGVAGQSSIARRTTRTTSLGRRLAPCRKPKLLTKRSFLSNFVFIFNSFKKTYPLYTLHELARVMQKSGIFFGGENCKLLLGKE